MKFIILNILFPVLIFFFFLKDCYAQSKEFEPIVFVNFNGIHLSGESDVFWNKSAGKIWGGGGLSTGIGIKRQFSKKYHMLLEVRYIQKGSVYTYTDENSTPFVKMFRLNYLEIPCLLGYDFKIKKKYYMFEAGPAFGRLFAFREMESEFSTHKAFFKEDNFKNYDLSVVNHLRFPLGRNNNERFLLGLRFSFSIFSIHKEYRLRNLTYGIELCYIL